MHLPRILKFSKTSPVGMDSKDKRHRKPRLDRRNAIKNIDYDAASSSSPDSSSSSKLRTRSLDLPSSYAGQTSFRVEGVEDGEFERICQSLGFSGPEDFAIPAAVWEARKARCSSDVFPISRFQEPSIPNSAPAAADVEPPPPPLKDEDLVAEITARVRISEELPTPPHQVEDLVDEFKTRARINEELPRENGFLTRSRRTNVKSSRGGGIKGARPPVLAPPPSMSLPVLDKGGSTWDLVRSFAPEDGADSSSPNRGGRDDDESNEDEDEGINGAVGETDQLTGSSSFSTSNDDDSSSSTTEPLSIISPNGRFRRSISSWTRGGLLGSGSFGTVYEGLSEDGFFFAVKEVSLLDQGSQAQQCIQQLEQEIALLSQFEHENIVQYLGTDKEEAKLYIFLELVTKGSLANLYQKYHLRETQVSRYTRQILKGLKYLHDRDVLHRDIKCGNILVGADGSVKLADFGLAKETSKLNKLKSCKGSAYWMAPEVVNPRMTYGLAADIWSLGCSVLEMLTRQPPYYPLEWTQAFFQIGHSIPPPIPNSLSSDAQDFIRQCLRVVPDDRPPASKLLDHPFGLSFMFNSWQSKILQLGQSLC
ncbi:hypothetical protein AAC387_Pa04g2678 [Persea americana]